MIPSLLLKLFDSMVVGFLNALPTWTFSIQGTPWIMATIRYLTFLNGWLPVDTAILPILGLVMIVNGFFLTRRVLVVVLNLLRGAGMR